jgi:hypothetical protein
MRSDHRAMYLRAAAQIMAIIELVNGDLGKIAEGGEDQPCL